MYLRQINMLCFIVSGPPQLNLSGFQRFQVFREGEGLRLACPVKGEPTPWVEWSKDDIVINSGWQRFRTLQRGHLKARELLLEDSGSYVCKATNGFGTISVQFHLFIRREYTLCSCTLLMVCS